MSLLVRDIIDIDSTYEDFENDNEEGVEENLKKASKHKKKDDKIKEKKMTDKEKGRKKTEEFPSKMNLTFHLPQWKKKSNLKLSL